MKRIGLVVLSLLILAGCSSKKAEVYVNSTYPVKEQAVLSDMKGYTLDDPSAFVVVDNQTFVSLFSSKEIGIYYIGYSGCPWCQELVPVLNTVLRDKQVNAYYLDVAEAANASAIQSFEVLDKTLDTDLQSGGYVPFVLVINPDGSIKTHLGTVDGHDAHAAKMTADQKSALQTILESMIQ